MSHPPTETQINISLTFALNLVLLFVFSLAFAFAFSLIVTMRFCSHSLNGLRDNSAWAIAQNLSLSREAIAQNLTLSRWAIAQNLPLSREAIAQNLPLSREAIASPLIFFDDSDSVDRGDRSLETLVRLVGKKHREQCNAISSDSEPILGVILRSFSSICSMPSKPLSTVHTPPMCITL